ncbi:hypothetical protein EDEG_00855 [Edhazardia aedis USNM 41457]|uniref:Uncharacterized protein n=1 Tax=Edhazardia aedis (strain USNM 41457) TaxID=1003232 RepID=J9DC77_EDHAE|nr:hypothetical protein EDEG_00855 [Edhazardia aedis USNM 41457]|eukprot:EJW05074.1 hypothetical protein EDEG_00855 [Edhazardia aedis USNM 41457]
MGRKNKKRVVSSNKSSKENKNEQDFSSNVNAERNQSFDKIETAGKNDTNSSKFMQDNSIDNGSHGNIHSKLEKDMNSNFIDNRDSHDNLAKKMEEMNISNLSINYTNNRNNTYKNSINSNNSTNKNIENNNIDKLSTYLNKLDSSNLYSDSDDFQDNTTGNSEKKYDSNRYSTSDDCSSEYIPNNSKRTDKNQENLKNITNNDISNSGFSNNSFTNMIDNNSNSKINNSTFIDKFNGNCLINKTNKNPIIDKKLQIVKSPNKSETVEFQKTKDITEKDISILKEIQDQKTTFINDFTVKLNLNGEIDNNNKKELKNPLADSELNLLDFTPIIEKESNKDSLTNLNQKEEKNVKPISISKIRDKTDILEIENNKEIYENNAILDLSNDRVYSNDLINSNNDQVFSNISSKDNQINAKNDQFFSNISTNNDLINTNNEQVCSNTSSNNNLTQSNRLPNNTLISSSFLNNSDQKIQKSNSTLIADISLSIDTMSSQINLPVKEKEDPGDLKNNFEETESSSACENQTETPYFQVINHSLHKINEKINQILTSDLQKHSMEYHLSQIYKMLVNNENKNAREYIKKITGNKEITVIDNEYQVEQTRIKRLFIIRKLSNMQERIKDSVSIVEKMKKNGGEMIRELRKVETMVKVEKQEVDQSFLRIYNFIKGYFKIKLTNKDSHNESLDDNKSYKNFQSSSTNYHSIDKNNIKDIKEKTNIVQNNDLNNSNKICKNDDNISTHSNSSQNSSRPMSPNKSIYYNTENFNFGTVIVQENTEPLEYTKNMLSKTTDSTSSFYTEKFDYFDRQKRDTLVTKIISSIKHIISENMSLTKLKQQISSIDIPTLQEQNIKLQQKLNITNEKYIKLKKEAILLSNTLNEKIDSFKKANKTIKKQKELIDSMMNQFDKTEPISILRKRMEELRFLIAKEKDPTKKSSLVDDLVDCERRLNDFSSLNNRNKNK